MDYIFLIYDIAAAVFIAAGMISGSRKGFIRSVLGLAVYIAAMILSGIISDKYTEPVYTEHIRPRIIKVIETEAGDAASAISEKLHELTDGKEKNDEMESNDKTDLTNPEFSDKINNVTVEFFKALSNELKEVLPDKLCDEVDSIADKDNAEKEEEGLYAAVLSGDMKAAAEYTEQKAVRPVMLKILHYVIWSLSYMVITLIGKIAVRIISHIRDFSPIRSADSLLGGILGMITGFIMCAAAALIIQLIIVFTSGGFGILTEEYIEQTYIFRYIYRIITI